MLAEELKLASVSSRDAERVTVGRPLRSGIELAVIGIASAMVGYVIGLAFCAPVVP